MRSCARERGKTKPWEQQPNLFISLRPCGSGRTVAASGEEEEDVCWDADAADYEDVAVRESGSGHFCRADAANREQNSGGYADCEDRVEQVGGPLFTVPAEEFLCIEEAEVED